REPQSRRPGRHRIPYPGRRKLAQRMRIPMRAVRDHATVPSAHVPGWLRGDKARSPRPAAGPKRWFFDAWSFVYDVPWVQRSTYWPIHDAIVATLRRGRHNRILDLGCGTGQLAVRLADGLPGARIVGCDFSAGMLSRAAARCPGARFVQSDGRQLPFADGVFYVIVSSEACHWCPDHPRALTECCRVLRPGGRLLLAVTQTPAALVSEVFHFGSRLIGEPLYWPRRRESRERIEAGGGCTGTTSLA